MDKVATAKGLDLYQGTTLDGDTVYLIRETGSNPPDGNVGFKNLEWLCRHNGVSARDFFPVTAFSTMPTNSTMQAFEALKAFGSVASKITINPKHSRLGHYHGG